MSIYLRVYLLYIIYCGYVGHLVIVPTHGLCAKVGMRGDKDWVHMAVKRHTTSLDWALLGIMFNILIYLIPGLQIAGWSGVELLSIR
jgi:hypothetical protein